LSNPTKVSVKPPFAILNRARETYSDAIKGKTDKNNRARTVGNIKTDPARRSAVEIIVWRRDDCGSTGSVFIISIRRLKAQPRV